MPTSIAHQKSKGFVLLAAVLSLLVFSSTLGLALFQFSLGSAVTTETIHSNESALALAEGCTEMVLGEIWADALFSEDEISLPTGECLVEIEHRDSQYTIRVQAVVGLVTKHITVECIRDDGVLQLLTWLEQ